MSLTTYIGSNVAIEEKGYEDISIEGEIFLGPTYADEESLAEVKKAQLSTTYVYEVSYNGWGLELTSYQEEKEYVEHKTGLLQVCELMDGYLQSGEYFELYSCWRFDEIKPKEAEIKLPLHGWFIENMELREQTLITFVKK